MIPTETGAQEIDIRRGLCAFVNTLILQTQPKLIDQTWFDHGVISSDGTACSLPPPAAVLIGWLWYFKDPSAISFVIAWQD